MVDDTGVAEAAPFEYDGLIPTLQPDDPPASCAKVIEEIAEGRHVGQPRSV